MTLSTGRSLGRYEILSPLGKGGMGEVYRARDPRLERDVAIKVLPESFAHDADARARFEREAKAVAALSHPNILAIHELGEADDIVFAVTECLEGETLRELLNRGSLSRERALELARQMANGLGAAHDKGIVHRDLKPENVFVTSAGVKILDFGFVFQQALVLNDLQVGRTPNCTRSVHVRVPHFSCSTLAQRIELERDVICRLSAYCPLPALPA